MNKIFICSLLLCHSFSCFAKNLEDQPHAYAVEKKATPDLFSKKSKVHPDVLKSSQQLSEALAQAYSSHPKMRSKVSDQYILTEGVSQALSGWRPDVRLVGSVARNWYSSESQRKDEHIHSPTSASAQITQNLFQGGKTMANTASAKAQVYAGFADLSATEQEVLLEAMKAYTELWSKYEMLELQEINVRHKKETVDQASARFDVGEVTRSDVAQAESELASALTQRRAAQAEIEVARQNYEQTIGMPAPKSVLMPAPLFQSRTMPTQFTDVEQTSIKSNPRMTQSRFKQQAVESESDAAYSELAPSLDAKASADRQLHSQRHNTRSNSASVGLSLTVPLYNQGMSFSRIRQKSQEIAKSKTEILGLQNRIIQEARQVWETRASSFDQIGYTHTRIRAAEIGLEGMKAEYNVGQKTIVEVLYAENHLHRARIDLVNAQKNYLIADYSLLASMGQLTVDGLNLAVEAYQVPKDF